MILDTPISKVILHLIAKKNKDTAIPPIVKKRKFFINKFFFFHEVVVKSFANIYIE